MPPNTGKRNAQTVDPEDTVVVVLGGGRGTRLCPLTRDRAKPAVSFGGKYRLIDIPLSNCLRSKFDRIFILTQFNSFSLNRHIWQTYSRFTSQDSFIDVIAAEQTTESGDWFQGPADAVRQSLRYVLDHDPRHVLVISADQIYTMDYRDLLHSHRSREADVTIAAHYVPEAQVRSLGIVKVNRAMRVVGFREKPNDPDDVADFRLDKFHAPAGRPFLCSMGIYLFNSAVLAEALDNDEEDFGKGVIPQTAERRRMFCHPFDGYWEDVGTIETFYKANMDWRAGGGIAGVFHTGDAIITHSRQLPPSRIDGTAIDESLIADGCHIRAKRIARSVVGVRARIGESTVVEDAIIMGNDAPEGRAPLEIGANCRIRRATIDKNAVIGDGSVIENAQGIRRGRPRALRHSIRHRRDPERRRVAAEYDGLSRSDRPQGAAFSITSTMS